MSATITDGSYAPSLTLFEVKMSKIFSSFHFVSGKKNKTKIKHGAGSRDTSVQYGCRDSTPLDQVGSKLFELDQT